MYEELFTKPNVNLVGYGYRSFNGKRVGEGIIVGVKQKVPLAALADHEIIPKEYAHLKTDVVEVGEIVSFGKWTQKHRPCPAGVSIGHYKITAGTFGTIVKDLVTKHPLILSNNHVLANSNDAEIMDPILQPGPTDGGTLKDDHLAALWRFKPIQFLTDDPTCQLSQAYAGIGNLISKLTGSSHKFQSIKVDEEAENKIDAAVAKPFNTEDLKWEILGIGSLPYGAKDVTLGDKVKKSGRTTEVTEDEIIMIQATVNVNYGNGKYAKFVDQLIAGPMSAGGDSGSLGLTEDNFAFGLLFAGSNEITIFNPIKYVLDELRIEL